MVPEGLNRLDSDQTVFFGGSFQFTNGGRLPTEEYRPCRKRYTLLYWVCNVAGNHT